MKHRNTNQPTVHAQSASRRRVVAGTAGAFALSGWSVPAFAQAGYPTRPMRMVVPWPPGQATDLAGRVVAQELSKLFGQPIVIDNKAGAGGTIGTDAVAKAEPDGYTLLAASSGPVTISPLMTRTPYDPERDLQPVAMVGMSPYVLVTGQQFASRDINDFIARVKAEPGKFTFASSGTGATAHLIAESFNAAVGLKAIHVPYKGSSPALTDVISGRVDYCIETAAATMPHVKGGRLRLRRVAQERQRGHPRLGALCQARRLSWPQGFRHGSMARCDGPGRHAQASHRAFGRVGGEGDDLCGG